MDEVGERRLQKRIDAELAIVSALRNMDLRAIPTEVDPEFFALLDKVSKMLRDDLATYYEGEDKDG